MESYAKQLTSIFEKKFELDFNLPLVFMDTHYNKSNPEEKEAFDREAGKLWLTTLNKKPFQCLTRYYGRHFGLTPVFTT